MRNLYVAVGLALCSTSVLAADFGIGISAKSDDGILYVPIDISKSLRIEPSVRYAKSESYYDYFDQVGGDESKALEIGVGVFGVKQLTDAVHIYFGGRLAYVDFDTSSFYARAHGASSNHTAQDGYSVGPTVGFEFLFGEHFSLGGEASYNFVDLEGESTTWRSNPFDSDVDREDIESKSHGTDTRLVLRYMF